MKKNFNKRRLEKEIRVALPDGTFRCVQLVGSVKLGENVVIHDVLLVNGFRHNLLSVGRLVEKAGILVQFTKNIIHAIFKTQIVFRCLEVVRSKVVYISTSVMVILHLLSLVKVLV